MDIHRIGISRWLSRRMDSPSQLPESHRDVGVLPSAIVFHGTPDGFPELLLLLELLNNFSSIIGFPADPEGSCSGVDHSAPIGIPAYPDRVIIQCPSMYDYV